MWPILHQWKKVQISCFIVVIITTATRNFKVYNLFLQQLCDVQTTIALFSSGIVFLHWERVWNHWWVKPLSVETVISVQTWDKTASHYSLRYFTCVFPFDVLSMCHAGLAWRRLGWTVNVQRARRRRQEPRFVSRLRSAVRKDCERLLNVLENKNVSEYLTDMLHLRNLSHMLCICIWTYFLGSCCYSIFVANVVLLLHLFETVSSPTCY